MPQTQFFWLDVETNQRCNFVFNPADLTNPQYDETRTIIGGSYYNPQTNAFSRLKRVPENSFTLVWVFKNTDILFSQAFTTADVITSLIKGQSGVYQEITLSMSKFQPEELSHCHPSKEYFTLELITHLTLHERRQRLWVYTDTKLATNEMQNVQLTQLSNVVYDEANRIIKCRLHRPNGTEVDLELITPIEQQKRARICVYQGTGIPIADSHLMFLLNKHYDEQGNLISASTFINDHLIDLEYITQEQQKQLSQNSCFVYANTALRFPHDLKEIDSRNIQYNVAEKTVRVFHNNQMIALERIHLETLKQRAENSVWVHFGTPNIVRPCINQLPSKNILMNDGIVCIDILIQQNWYPIEHLSIAQLKKRAEEMEWVYAGTHLIIESRIDLSNPLNSQVTSQKNLVQKLFFGTKHHAFCELISKKEQNIREVEKRWFYANTRYVFKKHVNHLNSTLEFDQQGHLIRATLKKKGTMVEYSSIKHRQSFNKKSWVNKETNEKITDKQPTLTQVTYDNNQVPSSGLLLNKDGTTTPVIFVSKQQLTLLQNPQILPVPPARQSVYKLMKQNHSEKVWVYANTITVFEENDQFTITRNTESNSTEELTRATGKHGDSSIPLEYIDRKTQALRAQRTWISLDTLKAFDDNEALANAKDIKFDNKDIPIFATVQQNEKSIPLANCNKKMVTRLKSKVWVDKHTAQIFEDEIDLANARSIAYDKKGFPKNASIVINGKATQIHLLSKKKYNSLLKKIWVYVNSNQEFTKQSELEKAEIQFDDQNKPIRATLTIDNEVIHLEFILSAAQKFRNQRIWINCNTLTQERSNSVLAKLEQIKYDNNGNPISAFLRQNGLLVPFISTLNKTAYTLAKKIWINEQTMQPIVTTVDLANAQNIEYDSQGIPEKALIKIEDKLVSIVNIKQDKLNDLHKVWVFANTGKLFPHPMVPEKEGSEYDDQGHLTKTTVRLQNKIVHLEYISTITQSFRNKLVAIDPNTNCRIKHYIALSNAQDLCLDKFGNPLSASISLGNKTIPINFVKRKEYTPPETVWVYDNIHIYEGSLENLENNNEELNPLTTTINGQKKTMEKLSIIALDRHLTQTMWVFSGTKTVVDAELLIDAQFTEYNILGYAIKGKLVIDNNSSDIELVSKGLIYKNLSGKRKQPEDSNGEEMPPSKKPTPSSSQANDLLTLANTATGLNRFGIFSSTTTQQENSIQPNFAP